MMMDKPMGGKELCHKCGKIATWIYMPDCWFACDDCVPRGCSCQIEFDEMEELTNGESFASIDEYNEFLESVRQEKHELSKKHARDEQGRLLPCVEFEYDKDGFEIDTSAVDVLQKMFDNKIQDVA